MACKRIIWAGRFQHAKGQLGMKLATEIFPKFKQVEFDIYAGPLPDKTIMNKNPNVRFWGIANDLIKRMKHANLIICSGRIALEAMSINVPVMAAGQRCYVGVLSDSNILEAKWTNFGDMNQSEFIDYQQLTADLDAYIKGELVADTKNYATYLHDYRISQVALEIRKIYQHAIS